MSRKRCRVRLGQVVGGLTLALLGALTEATAQSGRGLLSGRGATSKPAPAASANKATVGSDKEFAIKPTVLPVNPGDAIAVVNGEVISRQELANECVARKGDEILETMIARKLIEQEIKTKGLTVTSAEIDQEIDRVAQSMAGVGREAWLRTLHKERGISPVQYARDIIYPTLALRKLALPLVAISPKDYEENFATSFGEKLRCRMIMFNKLQAAKEVWEELKKNPDRFDKIAKDDPRSIDQGTRSLGGLMAEPVRRFAEPKDISKAVFHDLVDGDPTDSDKSRKPKDGDISGIVQVTSESWVIFKRESLEAAEKHDPNDPNLRKYLTDAIRENKVKDEMGKIYEAMMRKAKIENRLTGLDRDPTQEKADMAQAGLRSVDREVKLSSDPNGAMPEHPTLPSISGLRGPSGK